MLYIYQFSYNIDIFKLDLKNIVIHKEADVHELFSSSMRGSR